MQCIAQKRHIVGQWLIIEWKEGRHSERQVKSWLMVLYGGMTDSGSWGMVNVPFQTLAADKMCCYLHFIYLYLFVTQCNETLMSSLQLWLIYIYIYFRGVRGRYIKEQTHEYVICQQNTVLIYNSIQCFVFIQYKLQSLGNFLFFFPRQLILKWGGECQNPDVPWMLCESAVVLLDHGFLTSSFI